MELRHLRYFVAVAEELSFGRAASRLAIAQPPLSRQIRALEDEIGVRLLLRTKRQVLLTEAGSVFLTGARSALAQASRAADQARRVSRGENASLSVAFAPSAELALMRVVVQAFTRAHGDVRLDVHTCAEHETLRAVQVGGSQVAILPGPIASKPDLHVELLVSRRLRVVMPSAHALASRPHLHLRQLADAPIVLFARSASPALHDAVIAAFQAAGVPLNVRYEASQLHTCLELVAAGLGVTVMPAPGRRDGVVVRPIDTAVPPIEFVVAHRGDVPVTALQPFVRAARTALRAGRV